MEYINKDIIYINSTDRESGNSSNFSINIASQIRYPNNYDRVTLLGVNIPKSYYLINSTNNTFTITENSVVKTITIPNGNYSLSTMVSALQTLITAACSFIYVVSSSTLTGKITFTVSSNIGQPYFNFSTNNLYRVLGFDKSIYQMSANVLTSVNVVNFQLTNVIRIYCNIAEKNLLATVLPNVSDYSSIIFTEYTPTFTSKICTATNISIVQLTLIDALTSTQLDLNGLDWACKLAIYKENNFYKTWLLDRHIHQTVREFNEDDPNSNVVDQIPSFNKITKNENILNDTNIDNLKDKNV